MPLLNADPLLCSGVICKVHGPPFVALAHSENPLFSERAHIVPWRRSPARWTFGVETSLGHDLVDSPCLLHNIELSLR